MTTTATPSRVVVGTSLSEASDPLVTTAARIAKAMGATLYLMNAFEVPLTYAGLPFDPGACGILTDTRELRREHLRALEAQAARLGLATHGPLVMEAVEGPAHRVLAAVARREGAALAVVGAADSLAAHALGSTAGRLVRSAACPVLVVRGDLHGPRHILMPVDLSPISAEVVTAGLDLLGRMTGAGADPVQREGIAVEALFVVEPAGYEGFVPHFDLDGVKAAARTRLDEFLAAHNPAGWRLDSASAFGGPREMILDRVKASSPDLIITGTHGRSGFDRLLLGSVAEALVHACHTSVLVVPPRAARAAGEGGGSAAATQASQAA